MKYYVIEYENGAFIHGYIKGYINAIKFAESQNVGYAYTISEYDSEEDYENNK